MAARGTLWVDQPGTARCRLYSREYRGGARAREYTRFLTLPRNRFLAIANGSLIESEIHLFIARRLGYLEEEALLPLLQQTAEVNRLLQGLIRSLQAQIEK